MKDLIDINLSTAEQALEDKKDLWKELHPDANLDHFEEDVFPEDISALLLVEKPTIIFSADFVDGDHDVWWTTDIEQINKTEYVTDHLDKRRSFDKCAQTLGPVIGRTCRTKEAILSVVQYLCAKAGSQAEKRGLIGTLDHKVEADVICLDQESQVFAQQRFMSKQLQYYKKQNKKKKGFNQL
tara:strand:- start:765 stop:1313 length:549 start_codon:yes stop_codon:yes gene_type:complete